MNRAPRLSLVGIKSFRGREGYGLNATLLLDGVKVAEVLDEGNGGSTRYNWTDGHHDTPNEAKVHGYVRELGFTGDEDLDMLVAEMADEAENAKRMKRLAKTNVLFTLPQDMNVVFHKIKHNGRPEECRAAVLRKHPNAKFIEV